MRSSILLCGTVLAQLHFDLNSQGLIDEDDFKKLTIPSKTKALVDYLNAHSADYSGHHWTAFSEHYGFCPVGALSGSADPRWRPLPDAGFHACIHGSCDGTQPTSQRYRVCTLPDHPVRD